MVRPALRFKGVSKSFPGKAQALRDVRLDIPRGEFCVILGPSGAGKSTLLRLVNGLVVPDSGAVYLDDDRITRATLRSIRPRVAMVHQQFHLVPRLSVLDNVLAGALPRISTAAALVKLFPLRYKRRACELLHEVGLEPSQLYRRASSLSGGQQQRVAIARAFLLEPEVVLADEPVASLDPQRSRSILELLRNASRRHGATVLCSLHQVELATDFADRIVGMSDGRIVFDGCPEDCTATALADIYGERGDATPGPPRPRVSKTAMTEVRDNDVPS